MEFGLSEDQQALKKSAREFIEAEAPVSLARAMLEHTTGFERTLWDHMASLGWMGLAIPEAEGGLGLGLFELSVLLEEMGRTVLPSPFYSTVALAAPVLAAVASGAQRSEFLTAIASGSIKATVAIAEAAGTFDAAGVRAKATRAGSGWKLSGTKQLVPDAHLADEIVVLARTAPKQAKNPSAGISAFLVPAASLKAKPKQHTSLDRTRRLCEVKLGGTVVAAGRLLGEEGSAWSGLERGIDRAAVALAAEATGVADAVMERSVAYVRERQQFGRPIGSFQAVSHKCADMLIATESARSNTYYAAWALDEGVPDASLAAATAKSSASSGAVAVCQNGIQVHGGIGFTWEHDMHLYYRRAKFTELFLGTTDAWRDRIASLLE